jgi:hypothetical protein
MDCESVALVCIFFNKFIILYYFVSMRQSRSVIPLSSCLMFRLVENFCKEIIYYNTTESSANRVTTANSTEPPCRCTPEA